MLWAIKSDNNDSFVVTVIRANSRSEAIKLWAENESESFAACGELSFREQEELRSLQKENNDSLFQAVELNEEGEAGVLVDSQYDSLPKAPEPERKERPLCGGVRVVCNNTLSAALKDKRYKQADFKPLVERVESALAEARDMKAMLRANVLVQAKHAAFLDW